jgi:hypothetical protein
MVDLYAVGIGWDNDTLTVLDPQPASDGLQFSVRDIAVSGLQYDTGQMYCQFVWSMLEPEDYTALLTVMGLTVVASRKMTMRVLMPDRLTVQVMNGYLTKPAKPHYELGMWYDMVFTATHLREIE